MAVAPTGAIYKALEFDGVSSRTYGVYITGEAVYNAPKRDVEMITIPGRNGAFALDNGRFQNIEVSYPAGIFADNESDFAEAISEFRNYLCSKRGYCRLQDEYNPDEYRLAIYKSGLEVEPAFLKAGEFTITFECKPQRFLTSGETKQTIAQSGDTITNPTLFESGPLLEAEGYGTIEFNGSSIELYAETLGKVTLWDAVTFNTRAPVERTCSVLPLLNNGDAFFVNGLSFETSRDLVSQGQLAIVSTSGTNSGVAGVSVTPSAVVGRDDSLNLNKLTLTAQVVFPRLDFVYGVPQTYTDQETATCNYKNDGTPLSLTTQMETTVEYDGANTVVFRWSHAYAVPIAGKVPEGIGESTIPITDRSLYIDCDLGEVYQIVGDEYLSLNTYVDLGSKLPTLAPGSNAITYDNTITDLKVTPRWWKV